jgi:hypothetical protein
LHAPSQLDRTREVPLARSFARLRKGSSRRLRRLRLVPFVQRLSLEAHFDFEIVHVQAQRAGRVGNRRTR